MTVWGDCAVTENDDGTWTYSPNRKPISFAGLMDPHTPGTMFIIESAKVISMRSARKARRISL